MTTIKSEASLLWGNFTYEVTESRLCQNAGSSSDNTTKKSITQEFIWINELECRGVISL